MAANHGQWKKKGRVQRRRWTRRRFDSKQGEPYAVNECCFFQDKGWSDWFPYGGRYQVILLWFLIRMQADLNWVGEGGGW